MPAKPSYCHRIAEGIAAIEALDTDWVDRRQIEEAMGVSKTVAWRILRKCGADNGPGNTLVCSRAVLILRLKQLVTDGDIHEREIRRRGRLDEFLSKIRPEVIANLTKVSRGEQATHLLSSTFRKLPANVTLTPHSLHIDFQGMEEFLAAFGAVVYALNNDYEEISRFIGSALPEATVPPEAPSMPPPMKETAR